MYSDHLHPLPTDAQKQKALDEMRQRRAFATWPASLAEAAKDPWRLRLITVNAWAKAQAQQRQPRRPQTLTGVLRVAANDLKRAAAGDRDD